MLIASTVIPASAAYDRTALVFGGTTVPTPDQSYLDRAQTRFVDPTHPGETIQYIPVSAPMTFWPITGAVRVVELFLGPNEVWGLHGPAWTGQPLWRLTGLFDRRFDNSVAAGVEIMDQRVQDAEGPLVIYGYSQGAMIANIERADLTEQYAGQEAPDIDFVLQGDPNLPNGGLAARLPGLHLPIVNFTFNGAAPTDTPFDTVEINRRYDGLADFPLYPLRLLSTTKAVFGIVFTHSREQEVSLPATDPQSSPAYQGSHGNVDYYLFDSPDLPLFDPLRLVGVREPVIDVVEPVVKSLVERGYDRTIDPWVPTPARLIPPPATPEQRADLRDAVSESINNAQTLFTRNTAAAEPGTPPALRKPHVTTPTQGRPVHKRDERVRSAVRQGTDRLASTIHRLVDKITHKPKAKSNTDSEP